MQFVQLLCLPTNSLQIKKKCVKIHGLAREGKKKDKLLFSE